MPRDIANFVEGMDPTKTILFFGSGSSLPSGAPSVPDLIHHIATTFDQPDEGFSLAEIAELVERKRNDRKGLVREVRKLLGGLKPTGGLLSLPSYDWKSIYTTNYDRLIEDVYLKHAQQQIKVYTTNFDFSMETNPLDQRLYKLHGTVEKDVVDGSTSRLIISSSDYRLTEEYRQFLYKRLESDMSESTLVVIGHSLADPDIRAVIRKSTELKRASLGGEKTVVFCYSKDEDRAILLETDGFEVIFGSIDDFFHQLAKHKSKHASKEAIDPELFELPLRIRPSTIDVQHASNFIPSNFSRMFNGGSASYSDISSGLTFAREIVDVLGKQLLGTEKPIAVLLGTSGVGKTTACRQTLLTLTKADFLCWELKDEFSLDPDAWLEVSKELQNAGSMACCSSTMQARICVKSIFWPTISLHRLHRP